MIVLALSVSACKLDDKLRAWGGGDSGHLTGAADFSAGAIPLEQGKLHFQNQQYGLAERYFRQAVEQDPNNAEAWLNLAACYDQLRRFELAQRAYDVAIKQLGHTAAVHNNLGYHFYLRGNLPEAKRHFAAAYELEPDNPYIRNNLHLVDSYPNGGTVAAAAPLAPGPGASYK